MGKKKPYDPKETRLRVWCDRVPLDKRHGTEWGDHYELFDMDSLPEDGVHPCPGTVGEDDEPCTGHLVVTRKN